MLRKTACVSMPIFLLIILLHSPLASAATMVIPHWDRGWYSETGVHTTSNSNYAVGDGDSFSDVRNFFAFNLVGVTQPIASATLALFVPGPGSQPGYNSVNTSENYELHDVVTPIANLLNGTGGLAAHTDFGSGVVYGSRTMTAADMGKIILIDLNSSVVAAMNATHGLFAIGGSLTTLDALSTTHEVVFAWTHNGNPITELRLTFIPEPSTLLLLGIGAISRLGLRKPKSHG